jgi:AhpD family alkylhydroperoxidase
MELRLDYEKASPGALRAMMALEQHVARCGLEKPLMELVRLRASQINGCAYCVDLHTSDARKAGESERRLAAVVVWHEAPFFSDRERAALEWTEALTLISATRAPDEVWERVRPHFTDAEIVDLTLLINAINAWNRFAIGFRKLPV